MHVDVDLVRRKLEKNDGLRILLAQDPALVGLPYGAVHDLVLDRARVDVDEDAVGPGLGHGRVPDQAADAEEPVLVGHRMQGFDHLAGPDDREALGQILVGEKAVRGALAAEQFEIHVRVGQGDAHDQVGAFARFRGRLLQEFEPRGHVGEKVADLDVGPPGHGRPVLAQDAAVQDFEHVALAVCGGGGHAEAGHRGDAGQGLSPEAEARYFLQVLQALELAGGVAGDGEFELVSGDARPVVADLDPGLPAVADLDPDPRGPGVQRILQQLLEHAGRPLDHLARRDLILQFGGKQSDFVTANHVSASQGTQLREDDAEFETGVLVGLAP